MSTKNKLRQLIRECIKEIKILSPEDNNLKTSIIRYIENIKEYVRNEFEGFEDEDGNDYNPDDLVSKITPDKFTIQTSIEYHDGYGIGDEDEYVYLFEDPQNSYIAYLSLSELGSEHGGELMVMVMNDQEIKDTEKIASGYSIDKIVPLGNGKYLVGSLVFE